MNTELTRQIISCIDLTSLNDSGTPSDIEQLCQQARTPLGNVAAVCVYPQFISTAKECLQGTTIKIATVVNFPAGNDSVQQVEEMTQRAIQEGADEIDVVLPYKDYLAGNTDAMLQVIHACRQACKDAQLKVILETGALQDTALIKQASLDVISVGADFIKTSTGKIAIGATIEAVTTMLDAIQESSRPVGLKISGGVRTPEQASEYISLIKQYNTDVIPEYFRIGASSLLAKLCD